MTSPDVAMPSVPTVFVGVDGRQPLAYNVLQASIHRHASKAVNVRPLRLDHLPINRRGLTDFTYSRFLCPWLCEFDGLSIFMDADIVVTGDIHELFEMADGESAVQVMKDQARFEWASVMLFSNARCEVLRPEFVEDPANGLLDFAWAGGSVGHFASEWNHCVGYMPSRLDAKLYHFTQGIPVWDEVRGLPEDEVWDEAHAYANGTVGWKELMGKSVHARHVIERLVGRLTTP